MHFPPYKSITLGTYPDTESLTQSLQDHGFRIGDWAHDVLNDPNFTLTQDKRVVELVKVTPKDLGFTDGAYRTEIYKRALEHGLALCPLEVGPQLRLQYPDQPKLESLQIGMEPQTDSGGHRSEFRVVHGADNFLWLVGDHKHPDDFWGADEPFIFMKK